MTVKPWRKKADISKLFANQVNFTISLHGLRNYEHWSPYWINTNSGRVIKFRQFYEHMCMFIDMKLYHYSAIPYTNI